MQYRPLTEAEIDRAMAVEAYAFQASPDRAELAAGAITQLRGLFDGDQLLAQLTIIPLHLRTGLGEIAAGGLGGVASPPEARRRGYVAALLRHTADELRAAGMPLCILFPFKRPFYGRYGWATFHERKVYSGPPARFAHFRPGPGRFVAAGPAQIDELDRIYVGALRGRFGTIVRDRAWWERHVLHDLDRRPYSGYIWRDDQGRGRSYVICRIAADHSGGRRLAVREMVALDPTARAQLFAFVAGHEDQVASASFRAPPDAPVNLLFPDPLDCTVEPYFMLRLLDVPAALEGYRLNPTVSGRLTLAVSDDWLPANQGVYALEIVGGRCRVTRLAGDAPAGLRCDVRALAQIYSRYLRPRTAAAFGVIEAPDRDALALAEAAFAGLAPYSSDFF